MTTRDRLMLVGMATLALLAAVWLLVVSPERKQASNLSAQVAAAKAALASAESDAVNATHARQSYSSAYASVVSLGKAVPPSEEVPSLVYQLARASNQRHVELSSIVAGGTGPGAASGPSAPSPGTAAATPAGFTQMPFTFIFDGSFSDLYHLFKSLDASTVRTSSGGLRVSGRLLTLQAVKLEHTTGESQGKASASGGGNLTGTITATAYVLPADQGLAAGATPASPASTAATSASSAPSGGASSTGAPVATIGVAR